MNPTIANAAVEIAVIQAATLMPRVFLFNFSTCYSNLLN